eukprot:6488469-Amphidinium_carterae.1
MITKLFGIDGATLVLAGVTPNELPRDLGIVAGIGLGHLYEIGLLLALVPYPSRCEMKSSKPPRILDHETTQNLESCLRPFRGIFCFLAIPPTPKEISALSIIITIINIIIIITLI